MHAWTTSWSVWAVVITQTMTACEPSDMHSKRSRCINLKNGTRMWHPRAGLNYILGRHLLLFLPAAIWTLGPDDHGRILVKLAYRKSSLPSADSVMRKRCPKKEGCRYNPPYLISRVLTFLIIIFDVEKMCRIHSCYTVFFVYAGRHISRCDQCWSGILLSFLGPALDVIWLGIELHFDCICSGIM